MTNRWLLAGALLLLVAAFLLPACETIKGDDNDPDPVSFDPPPPPRHEVHGPQPGPQHVWIPGHWKWER
ncbi:MAG: hypothetical protein MUE73_06485, partial [Planctomycetes bacterium]|nr:hypothetical protein [Planctomycetota bacterium]